MIDPETGEETEEYALYLCRRCANSDSPTPIAHAATTNEGAARSKGSADGVIIGRGGVTLGVAPPPTLSGCQDE